MCMIRNGKTNAVTSLHGSATAFSVMHIYIRYSSALHLLARLQRTRSLGRLPYEDLAPKSLMKTSFQRTFDPKSSQG